MKKFFWIFAICFFVFSARGVGAFSINPLKYFATIDAGKEESFLVSVKNTSDKVRKYKPIVLSAVQNKDGSAVFLKGVDLAENWVEPKEAELEIVAGATSGFEFVARVPAGSAPGSHYIGLGVEEVSEGGLSGRLVAILHIQVAGKANESLEIKKIKASDYFLTSPKLDFSVEFVNQGNVDLEMNGNLVVRSYFGREVYNEQTKLGSRLLPQSTREIKNNLSFEKIKLPGIYTATISTVYGVTQQTVSDSFSFLYLPVWSILIFIIFVILAVVLRIYKR